MKVLDSFRGHRKGRKNRGRGESADRGSRRPALRIAAAVLLLLGATAACLQGMYMKQRAAIRLYLENSTPVCRIPDIDRGFIPQGLSYDPGSDRVLITGYMGLGGNSPIYVAERGGGQAKKVLMRTPDGGRFAGHAGGLSIFGGHVYIAGSTGGCMYAYSLPELLRAPDGTALNAALRIPLKNAEDTIRVSFTAADGALLYAGEFHKDPIFRTHPSHTVTTPDGKQKAYLLGFTPDRNGGAVPALVYSIPDNVQGVCFDDRFLYLSQTDSLFSARILTYAREDLKAAGTKNVLGHEVPLYCLTESSAHKITPVAPMSEELLVVDDRLYILYESASNRYLIGKRLGLDHVLSTPVSYFR